jgi:WD40 repeat protein
MTKRVAAHVSAIFSVAVSPDGKLLASGANDGAVKIWSTDSLEPVRSLPGQNGKVRTVAWTPDGSAVISAGGKGVLIQEASTGTLRRALELPGGRAADSFALTPDGKTIVVTAHDGALRGFTLDTGAVTFDATQPMPLYSVAMSPDGSVFATGSTTAPSACGTWPRASSRAPSRATLAPWTTWRGRPTVGCSSALRTTTH